MLLTMTKPPTWQDTESPEGYYDLSGFESASGLYLLQDSTFFYYASFGSVDLKVAGRYAVSGHRLSLQPDEALKKEFMVYGRADENAKDRITITYFEPYEQAAQSLFLSVGDVWHNTPSFTEGNAQVTLIKGTEAAATLTLGYSVYESDSIVQIGKIHQVSNLNYHHLIIYHNYYAKMVKNLTYAAFELWGDTLLDSNGNGKKAERQDLTEQVISEVVAYAKKIKGNSTIQKNGYTYQKVAVDDTTVSLELVAADNGGFRATGE